MLKFLAILFINKLYSVLNFHSLITFFRTVFTSEEADLARCIGVICNAGFSPTKAEIIVS